MPFEVSYVSIVQKENADKRLSLYDMPSGRLAPTTTCRQSSPNDHHKDKEKEAYQQELQLFFDVHY